MAAKSAPKRNLSAEKRARQAEKRNLRNRMVRSRVKSAIREVETSVKGNDKEKAEGALRQATKTIMTATSKGVLHSNNAARKISRLSKLVNTAAKA